MHVPFCVPIFFLSILQAAFTKIYALLIFLQDIKNSPLQ